jgi:hypothetical protein
MMTVELKFATPFLKAGVVSQVLVKNSQAWCVDGQSVFVVRTGKLAYLRIEMPCDADEDRDLVEGFKQALSGIIRYEVTPCPFKRGFSVEIPEEAKTPRKKKAWKPKHTPLTRLDRWEFGARSSAAGDDRDTASDFGSVLGEESDDTSSQTSGLHLRSPSRPSKAGYHSSPIPIPGRPASRAVSEPARSFESLLAKFQLPADPTVEIDDASPTSSVDSFYSFQDTVSGSLFSPPYLTPAPSIHASYSADDLHILPFPRHHRELSEVTVRETATADATPIATRIARSPLGHDKPPTPSSLPAATEPEQEPQIERVPASARRGHPSETFEIEEPHLAEPTRRRPPLGRRDLSPLPPASALFVPSRTSDRSFATALIRRTCSLVFETPVQLLFMLLRLAANIATKREHARKQSQTDESDGTAIPLSTLTSRDGQSHDSRQQQPPGGWSELD